MTDQSFRTASDAAVDRLVDLLVSGGGGESTPTPEPEGNAPASADAGTTPADDEGADPTGPDAASPEDKATEEPASTADAPGFDPQKTLSKYATPEERDRALIESQRTILERQEENRRLKAELETLRSGKPAVPPTTPEAPATKPDASPATPPAATSAPAPEAGYAEFLSRVHAAKPEELSPDELKVTTAIATLKADKTSLDALATAINETETKESEKQAEIARLETILAAHREDLKSEPDDYALQARIEGYEKKVETLRREAGALVTEANRLMLRHQRQHAAFNDRIVQVERFSQGIYEGRRHAAQSTAAEAEVNAEWDGGAKRLFETDLKTEGFTPFEQKAIMAELRDRLEADLSRPGAVVPANLYEWQRSQTAVFDEARKHRTAIQQASVQRRASTLPTKPKDNVVSGGPAKTQARGSSSSSRNFLRDAESRLDKALGL